MEWLHPTSVSLAELNALEWLAQTPLTEIVFVFLCSKPVFLAAALVIGLQAHFAGRKDRPKKLPREH